MAEPTAGLREDLRDRYAVERALGRDHLVTEPPA
jgi:hypothetical protein